VLPIGQGKNRNGGQKDAEKLHGCNVRVEEGLLTGSRFLPRAAVAYAQVMKRRRISQGLYNVVHLCRA
jgi:hypothetical protein